MPKEHSQREQEDCGSPLSLCAAIGLPPGADLWQTNASKTDSLLTQHAGKSLEELVAERIINADQKAQVMKKPVLQAQLAQMEEQLAQYQKVHEQYRSRAVSEKAEGDKLLAKAKADAVAVAEQDFKKSLHQHLLVLSQFLRLAAYRREEAKEPGSDESQAIEGVLLAIYAGDESAVASMLKLIEGSEEQILSVPGEQLQTTCSLSPRWPRTLWLTRDRRKCQVACSRLQDSLLPRERPVRRIGACKGAIVRSRDGKRCRYGARRRGGAPCQRAGRQAACQRHRKR